MLTRTLLWLIWTSLAAEGLASGDEFRVQPVELPLGEWSVGVPEVPGPPVDCVLQVTLVVPHSVCESVDMASALDASTMEADRRLESAKGYAGPVPATFKGSLDGALAAESRCALRCDAVDHVAQWQYFVADFGFRGALTCDVLGLRSQTVSVVEPGGPLPDGVSVFWSTTLPMIAYVGRMSDYDAIMPAEVHAMNLCPAGQPSRAGPVVGGFPRGK